jgi:hypothetical protein
MRGLTPQTSFSVQTSEINVTFGSKKTTFGGGQTSRDVWV